jgi:acyl carrier protein
MGVNMTTGESIEARIVAGLAKIKKQKPESIQKQARLTEDLDIDSLDSLDLIFQLEEEFNIEISPEDQLQFCTVQDVIAYVQQRVGQTLARSA